jgi:uncharacterized repeat protein (TIGR02543 family)
VEKERLCYWDDAPDTATTHGQKGWVVAEGDRTFYLAASSRDIRLQTQVDVTAGEIRNVKGVSDLSAINATIARAERLNEETQAFISAELEAARAADTSTPLPELNRLTASLNLKIAQSADRIMVPSMHTVTFVAEDEETAVEVMQGLKVARPADPYKEDYTFIGWFVGEEKFDFDTPVVSELTLTARWEKTITSIRINAIAIETVRRGETKQFTVTLNEGASDAGIVWTTANSALATVADDGTVTIKNVIGTVVLTATDPLSGRSHSVLLRIAS